MKYLIVTENGLYLGVNWEGKALALRGRMNIMNRFVTALMLVILCEASLVMAQEWQVHDVGGGLFIELHPAAWDSNLVLAGTPRTGLFVFDVEQQLWTSLNSALPLDPDTADVPSLYTGHVTMPYVTHDEIMTIHWGDYKPITKICTHQDIPGYIALLMGNENDSRILITDDLGETWWSPLSDSIAVDLAIDRTNPARLLATIEDEDLWGRRFVMESVDSGQTWTEYPIVYNEQIHETLAKYIDQSPCNPDIWYLSAASDGTLLKSSNNGETWNLLQLDGNYYDIRCSPVNIEEIWFPIFLFGTHWYVYRSINSGNSIELLADLGPTLEPYVVFSQSGHAFFPLADGISVVRAEPFGGMSEVFELNSQEGWHLDGYHNIAMVPLEYDGGQALWAGEYGAGYRQNADAFFEWMDDTWTHTCVYDIAVSPANEEEIVIAGTHGLSHTTDGGTTWNRIFSIPCDKVVISGDSGQNFIALALGWMYLSTDHGQSWTGLENYDYGKLDEVAIEIDPFNSNHVLFGYHNFTEANLMESNDGGLNWEIAVPNTSSDLGIIFSPTQEGHYAYAAGTTRYVTTIGGAVWWERESPPGKAMCFGSGQDNDLYVVDTDSVYRTTLMGETWTNITANLPHLHDHPYWTVVPNPTVPNSVIIGTLDAGMFSFEPASQTWYPVEGDYSRRIRSIHLSESGRLLAGSNGEGLWENPNYTEVSENKLTTVSNRPVKPGFDLFPNPTNQFITLTMHNHSAPVHTIAFYNILGQLVHHKDYNFLINTQSAYTLDISRLSSGVYFVIATSEGGSYGKKLNLIK